MEISAGGGNIIGGTFEDLAIIMEGLVKFKSFGGICLDTQHAFAGGYDLRTLPAVAAVFKEFDRTLGLKYLKMSHINDSKMDLGSHKDRHEHIGEGKIGEEGFKAFLSFLQPSPGSEIRNSESEGVFPLILETNHDKVKADINILKALREGIKK
jgi:apurinic endonuclease APN1